MSEVITSGRFILSAIRGGRLSYHSEGNSDSVVGAEDTFILGPNDREWLRKRFQASVAGETKTIRCFPVSFMVRASATFHRHLSAYRVGITIQSSSLMHRTKSRGPFTREDFSVEEPFASGEVFQRYLEDLNNLWAIWATKGARRNDRQSKEWQNLVGFVANSYMYTAHVNLNYEVLRLMHTQRRNHRLQSEWGRFFDQLLPQLPLSELITEEVPFLLPHNLVSEEAL